MPGPEVTHTIRAHWITGCAPASAEAVQIDLAAAGDFDPSPDTFATLTGKDGEEPLVAPTTTQAVVLDATDRFSEWSGLGTRDQDGDTDVALWPKRSACTIPSPPNTTYPTSDPGQAAGITEDGRTLLVAGGDGRDQRASALAVDLATGVARRVSGVRAFRSGGTVTPFGAGLLVAGGDDLSDLSAAERPPLASAEVFDPATQRFDVDIIVLQRPRTRHGAVTLASGETLLVGGVGTDGKLISTLEAIAPGTRDYRIDNLTELEWPRKDPVVLRLSDDTVLVAGGTDGSAVPIPVDSLEWLSADGARTVRKTPALSDASAPLTVQRAFAVMPGGSVLAAGGCEAREPATDEEKKACDACGPNNGCPSRRVLWITKDGDATALPDELDVDAPHPVLVAGSEGRPWLICDAPGADASKPSDAPGPDRSQPSEVRQFDPFLGHFVVVTDGAPAPTARASHFVHADAGLFLWLDADTNLAPHVLAGFRHGTRNAFTSDVSPLLSTDLAGAALDRPPGSVFDPANQTVRLSSGGATLVVTDTTYTDLHLAITVVHGPPPVVRLGNETYGSSGCSWPRDGASDSYTATLDRTNDRVALGVGGTARTCAGPNGRVSVEIGAGGGDVEIAAITVTRGHAQ